MAEYFHEDWSEYIHREGTEAEMRYLAFVNLSPRTFKRVAQGRTAVTVTLAEAHARRLAEYPRGQKSALVNRLIVRGWLWPRLWKFAKSLAEENKNLRSHIMALEVAILNPPGVPKKKEEEEE